MTDGQSLPPFVDDGIAWQSCVVPKAARFGGGSLSPSLVTGWHAASGD
jgi:hypothetical protein